MSLPKDVFANQVVCQAGLVTNALHVTGDAVLAGQGISQAGIKTDNLVSTGSIIGPKTWITHEGGIAILMKNKTGAPSVKGTIVHPGSSETRCFELAPVGEPDIIGVVYNAGVPDGADCWVVISGYADVFFIGDTTAGHFARNCIAADTGDEAGKAISETLPTSPFATDKHFLEIGHVVESRVGAGLAGCIIHFN